jgi:hypothetical protein
MRLNREFEAKFRAAAGRPACPRVTLAQWIADWGDEKVDAIRAYGARLVPPETDEAQANEQRREGR